MGHSAELYGRVKHCQGCWTKPISERRHGQHAHCPWSMCFKSVTVEWT
jgi:hypothetical protein